MSLHSQTDPAIDRREPQIHFARGEISLFIRHRPGLTATAIINQIEEYKALLRNVPDLGFDQPLAIYLTPERVVTFDRSKFARERTDDGQAYSLVFIAIPAIYDEQIALRYIDLLRLRFNEHGLDRHATFAFQSVTPNWLAGGAGENNGSGGPGARPVVPALISPPPAMPESLCGSQPLAQRGQCTDIFILDTAPCELDLRRAYWKWVEAPLRSGSDHNQLLDALIGPAGALGYIHDQLRIEYAGHSHLLDVVNAFLPEHNYVMSDHGLFVASIINQYAPAARLHLIEVLNPYGVGTLETIASGFARAADYALANPCAHVVVNASLFLDTAQADSDSLKLLIELDPFWQRYLIDDNGNMVADEAELNRIVEPLAIVCDFLKHQAGVEIVAASGNDGVLRPDPVTGTPQPFHPAARFPAAYPSVLGVAARNYDGSEAIYSNQPDRPVIDGVQAFGGNAIGEVADPEYGAIGAYIGAFPDRTPNQLGLARWAGTSFATPIVTAAVATLLCDGLSPASIADQVKLGFAPTGAPGAGSG